MQLLKLMEQRRLEKERKRKAEVTKKIAKGTFLGLLSGLTAGLTSGVLFAPKSGKETREDIAKSAQEIGENIKVKSGEFKEVLDETLAETKDNVVEAKEKIVSYLASKRKEKVSGDEALTTEAEAASVEEVQP